MVDAYNRAIAFIDTVNAIYIVYNMVGIVQKGFVNTGQRSTYLATLYSLCGAAPIGLSSDRSERNVRLCIQLTPMTLAATQ